jgi:Fe-S oxidoreductase/nitrate reductase gamma subunit
MEATREIYWNVGHGVVWGMYLLTAIAFALCAYGLWQRVLIWRQGRALVRHDQFSARLLKALRTVLSQSRVARVTPVGLFHSIFFWGFALLFIGTLLIMAQADFTAPFFDIVFLKGTFYKGFSLVLDLAGLAALLMLGGLAIRRFVIRPQGLPTIADDSINHLLLFTILLTGFLVEGLRIAATELVANPALSYYSPVGRVVALLFAGTPTATLLSLHKGLWWFHLLIALGFIALIPFGKLRHIFTTSANAFFVDRGAKGALPLINLEDESLEEFGAGKVTDLTWKDLFDADACTSCLRCQDRCPAYNTGKPLSPMKVVQQIGEIATGDVQGDLCATVSSDVIWACTTCRACQEICPANIEHINKILEMRRKLALMDGEFPGDEVRGAISNIEVNGNPFGLAFAGRGDWTAGLPVITAASGAEFDILYFVGCYASFDQRNREIARAFVRICAAAGIRVGILGKEEKCCGEPARKLGNEYLYQMLAQENIEMIKGYNVKQIVTTCPHCFNTLGRDYRDLGLDLPVEHYTTFVVGLLKEGKIHLSPEYFPFTYHDSCYIGRYQDIYTSPRTILAAAGGVITEMEKTTVESFCCGAGGGRIFAEEKIGNRINVERVQMASATGAPLLVSNCPFCLTMFEDGIKTGGVEKVLQVKDLAEIVASRLVSSEIHEKE